MLPDRLPDWDELPNVPDTDVRGCAWSVWGEGDNLGTINMLTPEVVARAAKEGVQTGHCVRLDWALNYPERPGLNRSAFKHKIITRPSGSHDDELSFNPQSGSQWDGLRHYGLYDAKLFYGGTKADSLPTGDRKVTSATATDCENDRLGIHHWARHGINGRGVLLDFARFAADIDYAEFSPTKHHAISTQQLEAVAKLQGVDFRQGDILVVRTGFIKALKESSPGQVDDWLQQKEHCMSGVDQSDDMRRFLWNNHFAAFVGDAIAFECMPPKIGDQMLHRDMIALWGAAVGEMFDLEELSETCQKLGRYTFFFTGLPLNVIGGVSSPPCAQALF